MSHRRVWWSLLLTCLFPFLAWADPVAEVADLPTRPGVTQRLLVLAPEAPKAVVVLFPGGHGGLQIAADGSLGWGGNNFLVRSRNLFAARGLVAIVVDAPSDRQAPLFLTGFRQSAEHAEDIRAVVAWARRRWSLPVWLVGTSRGTQSAAAVAVQSPGADGPDGLVLTSTILSDRKSVPVPALPLEKLRIPVLVVHHEEDGCSHCAFSGTAALMRKLENAPRKALLPFRGGVDQGDPCEALAHHGYNGIEPAVVNAIADWILAP